MPLVHCRLPACLLATTFTVGPAAAPSHLYCSVSPVATDPPSSTPTFMPVAAAWAGAGTRVVVVPSRFYFSFLLVATLVAVQYRPSIWYTINSHRTSPKFTTIKNPQNCNLEEHVLQVSLKIQFLMHRPGHLYQIQYSLTSCVFTSHTASMTYTDYFGWTRPHGV